MDIEQERFLAQVVAFVKADPEMGPHITEACSMGINLRLREEQEKASDLECALVALVVDRQNDWARATLLQKIEKWNGKLSLRWDDFIATIKKKRAA